jgi:hypothetical protein
VNDSVAAYLLDSKVSWGPVPDQRYQTATELADAAHHALTEGPQSTPRTPPVNGGVREHSRLEEYARGG